MYQLSAESNLSLSPSASYIVHTATACSEICLCVTDVQVLPRCSNLSSNVIKMY